MFSLEGDVKLFQTDDNGEITIEGGVVEMTQIFDTMAYLCLFGGNDKDDGTPGSNKSWWGNVGVSDPDFQYRSETQHLIDSLPATPANLRTLEDGARRDLSAFVNQKIANKLEVFASIPSLNTVNISVTISAIGQEFNFNFTENWSSSNGGS